MNTQAQFQEEDDSLRVAVGYSLAAHALLFVIFVVRAFVFPTEPIDLRSSIRVDLVGLPDKVQQLELPAEPVAPPQSAEKLPAPMPPAPVEAKPNKPTLPVKVEPKVQNQKTAQDNALKKLEALNKIEKMVQNQKRQSEAKTAPATAPIRGNQIATGTALSGLAKVENDDYTLRFRRHVHQHWSLPEWLSQSGLKAVIAVYIDAQGQVLKKEFLVRSGNAVFDERVQEAIDKASPFPPPPSRLVDRMSVDGVRLRFPEE